MSNKYSDKSKNNWKLFTYVGVGSLILGGAIGGAVVFFIHNNKETVDYGRANVGPLKEYDFEYKDEKGNVINSIPGLKIKQYKTKKADGVYDYYLSDSDVNKFIGKFFEIGFFGPEIFNLKTIWISKLSIMDESAAGTYYVGTNEMTLDPSGPYEKMYKENIDNNSDIKIEALMGVMYHEYGHHFAYSYVNNPFPKKSSVTENIYMNMYENGKKIRVPDVWNNHFVQGFKRELKYDKHTPKFPLLKDQIIHPIGAKYDAKDLFDAANQQDDSMANIDTHNLVHGVIRDENGNKLNHPLLIINQDAAIKKDNLKYLYSLSELFTRKLTVMSYRTTDSFYSTLEKHIVPSLIEEDSFYRSIYGAPLGANWNNKAVPGYRYMQDGLYNSIGPQAMTMEDHTNTAKNIYDLILQTAGQKNGADISYIWGNNPYTLKDGKTYFVEGDPRKKYHYINFGGYITAEQYNIVSHVGYYDQSHVFRGLEIIKRRAHFGYKAFEFTDQWEPLSGQQYFYVLKNPVDRDTIANKPLYFAENANGLHAQPMQSVRDTDQTDYSSTMNWFLPSTLLDEEVYKAVNDATGVKIVKSGINNRGRHV